MCDVWSLGVILYLLLSGNTPFYGDTIEETKAKILEGKVEYKDVIWERVSNEAKEFINKLLQYSPENRINVRDALNDPWIHRYSEKNVGNEYLFMTLTNLQSFHTQMTLQKAVLSYIASQELSKKHEENLRSIFNCIDTDRDGRITKEELKKAYMKVGKSIDEADSYATWIMKRIDLNRNDTIDYNEFLMANLTKENALTKPALQRAFDFMDTACFYNNLGPGWVYNH